MINRGPVEGTDTCLSHALIPGTRFDLARLRGRVSGQSLGPGRFYAACRGSVGWEGGSAAGPGSAREVPGPTRVRPKGKVHPQSEGHEGLAAVLGGKCPREQRGCLALSPPPRGAGSEEVTLSPLTGSSPKGSWWAEVGADKGVPWVASPPFPALAVLLRACTGGPMAICHQPGATRGTESSVLEEISRIIQSSHQPSTTIITPKPCP